MFFKQKTAYEMRIRDWSSTCALPISAINIISTTIMLRLGKVYRGQMVDMVVSNAKLQRRAAGIVQMLTKCSEEDAVDALERGENSISRAVLIAMGNSPNESAKQIGRAHV